MKTFFSILVFSTLASGAAMANTYVKCGQLADWDAFTVTGYELELSSEDGDEYKGPVGIKWNMRIGSEQADWLKTNKSITATSSKKDGSVIVEIKMIMAKTPSGPVGTRYKLIGLYDEMPKLEKYNIGGFTGNLLVGTFECITSND